MTASKIRVKETKIIGGVKYIRFAGDVFWVEEK